jgi:hypothetical protein
MIEAIEGNSTVNQIGRECRYFLAAFAAHSSDDERDEPVKPG